MKNYIVFDGACNLCNSSAFFFAKRDIKNKFTFVPSQSELGETLLKQFSLKTISDESIVLIQNEKIFLRSTALKKILLQLPGYKIGSMLLSIIPICIADSIYDFVAKNRKREHQNNTCSIANLKPKKKLIV